MFHIVPYEYPTFTTLQEVFVKIGDGMLQSWNNIFLKWLCHNGIEDIMVEIWISIIINVLSWLKCLLLLQYIQLNLTSFIQNEHC